jgi:hypothetical protein
MQPDGTVTVARADLDVLVTACLSWLPDEVNEQTREAFTRLDGARYDDAGQDPGPLPDGFFGRVELPGYRSHTGFITEETRFGAQVAVVRDWNGALVAEVCIGPMCQVVHLPAPLRRPEPAALTAGSGYDDEVDYPDYADLPLESFPV